MRHSLPLLLLFTLLSGPAVFAQTSTGEFEGQADVGGARRVAPARFDPADETYTVSGSGSNMWGGRDEFHFVWRRMRGDFILTARASFVGRGVEPHRKLGWIARASLDASAAQVSAVVHGDGLASLQFRRAEGSDTGETKSSTKAPDVIQLERKGGRFPMSVARFGEPFASETVEGVSL